MRFLLVLTKQMLEYERNEGKRGKERVNNGVNEAIKLVSVSNIYIYMHIYSDK